MGTVSAADAASAHLARRGEQGEASWRGAAPWILFGLTVALAGATLVFAALSGYSDGWYGPLAEIVILIWATLGLMVVRRRPGNVVGWLLLINGLVLGFDSFVTPYAYYANITEPGSLAGGRWAAMWDTTEWPTLFAGVVAIAFVFPDGRLPTPRWRPVAWAAIACFAATLLLVQFESGPLDSPFQHVSRPLPALPDAVTWAWPILILGLLASLVAGALAIRVRLKRAQGVQRLQLLWLTWAALLIPATLLVCLAEGLIAGTVNGTALGVSLVAMEVAIPLAVGIAILRHRLFDIELVINRTLVYGALSVCVVVAYVAIVSGLEALIHSSGVPGLIAVGLIAAGVQPLRIRLQAGVDRLVYGDRSDPYSALRRLGERLEGTLAPGEVTQTIVDSVAEALRLPYVAVEFDREGAVEVVAAHGHPGRGEAERIELTYQGETVGELALMVPPGRELSVADRRLLADLAKHSGPPIRAFRLTADLQRSRERLVTAREEERRRLRRDLHDGLGPTLAGIVLELDAARDRLDDPDAAEGALRELREETQEAIAEVRRLVYELRPPALDELGLFGAVSEQAAHLGGDAGGRNLEVSVDVSGEIPAMSAATEVAAYRIATEALTNVVRHADARHCHVRFGVDARSLEIQISDDGGGLDGTRPGVGMTSMRERAAELGGAYTAGPRAGGGTLVRASLPLTAA